MKSEACPRPVLDWPKERKILFSTPRQRLAQVTPNNQDLAQTPTSMPLDLKLNEVLKKQ